MQTECGYTPQEARETTLFDVNDLYAYWRRNPPPGALIGVIAQGLRWKPAEAEIDPMSFEEAAARDAGVFDLPERWFPNKGG